jgi:hypothetical protein
MSIENRYGERRALLIDVISQNQHETRCINGI